MARVGGRNTSFAWIVGLVCAAVVGGLVWLAAPLVPGTVQFVGDQLQPPTSGPVAGVGEEAAPGELTECRDLYPDALWTALVRADDALLSPSTDRPASSADGVVDALAPSVVFTCRWTSAEGEVSTTLADVPPDAGAIARTALPALGFACEDVTDRVRCERSEEGVRETIETGGGRWLSTRQDGWEPPSYVAEVGTQVWPG